jgi:Ni/Co efflux regulator RcnB
MKNILKIAPLVLALAAVATPAMADGRGNGHGKHHRGGYSYRDRDDDRRWDRDDRRAYRYGYRDGRRHDRDWDDRYDRRDRRYHPVSGHWDNGRRGPPPWARGRDYRAYGYRNVYYVPVNDYARYRLHRPDYGYRWVRDDRNNFLLVAAASGIISQILRPGY